MNCEFLFELEVFDLSFYGFEFSGSSAADEEVHGEKVELKISIFSKLFASCGWMDTNGRKLSPFFELQNCSRLGRASEKVIFLHFFQDLRIKSP